MRLIIAGGRDRNLSDDDCFRLSLLHIEHGIRLVVVGGATGVDTDAQEWAEVVGIPVVVVPAEWDKHGRAAGPIRNREMARMASAVVLFPGGRGTQSMHNVAQEYGLDIFDWRIASPPDEEASDETD